MPTADSYITSALPTKNYGSATMLYVGRESSGAVERSLFRFDLSGLPPGATIVSAMFQACVAQAPSSPAVLNVAVRRIDSSWQEMTVNWNTKLDSTPLGKVTPVGVSSAYTGWEITGLVQTWVDGATNRGLMLVSSNESVVGWRAFASRESSSPPYPPRLVVTYLP